MHRSYLIAIVLLAAGCGALPSSNPVNGGSGQFGGTIGPKPDAGTGTDSPDGGSAGCTGDPDAAHLGTLALSEIATTADGYVEFANETGGPQNLAGLTVEGAIQSAVRGTLETGSRGTLSAALGRDGELALRDGGQLVQYVCWGVAPISTVQNEAVSLGLWVSGLCAATPPSGKTLHLRGNPFSPEGWTAAPASPRGCP